MESVATKLCPDCKVVKPIGDFYGGNARSRRLSWICKLCSHARRTAYRKLQPEKVRDSQLKSKFGISLEDYENLLVEQKGVCAICKNPPGTVGTGNNGKGTLAVDHCHVTGTFRGLLCTNCNLGVGSFFESPELLGAAAAYVKAHQLLVMQLLAEKTRVALVQGSFVDTAIKELSEQADISELQEGT